MQIYANGTAPVAPPSPTAVSYQYFGCYSDSQVNRTFDGPFETQNGMTVEICGAFCNGEDRFPNPEDSLC